MIKLNYMQYSNKLFIPCDMFDNFTGVVNAPNESHFVKKGEGFICSQKEFEAVVLQEAEKIIELMKQHQYFTIIRTSEYERQIGDVRNRAYQDGFERGRREREKANQ